MQTENETPQGENENLDAQGTTEAPATGSTSAVEPESMEEGKTPEPISREEYEKLQKEFQKLEMERNNLRNKQEEERRKALEEQGNWEQIAKEREEELQRIREEQEAQEARNAAEQLRKKFIDEYPDEAVRKAAKALIEKNPTNLAWGDVETEDQARAAVTAQLDALKETMGILSSEQDDQPDIDSNNPMPSSGDPEIDKLRNMSADELRKVLPIAEDR